MSAMHRTRSHRQWGVTLTELVVAMTIVPIIIGSFIYAIYAGINTTQRSNLQFALDSELQIAMDVIERDIRFAKSFKKTVPARFSDQYGARNQGADDEEAWSYKGVPESANGRALLLEIPATTQSPLSNARQPVFQDDGDFNCSTQLTLNPELTYIVIYFIRDGSLYRRILTDTTTPTCNDVEQNQKQSCPRDAIPPHASCQARDELIANNMTQFGIAYYTALAATPIANVYSSADPDILSIADDAEVTLTAGKLLAGRSITATITLRIGTVNAVHED